MKLQETCVRVKIGYDEINNYNFPKMSLFKKKEIIVKKNNGKTERLLESTDKRILSVETTKRA